MQVLEWVREALHANHADEWREHEEAIKRHQAEYEQPDERVHAMYVDSSMTSSMRRSSSECRTSGARTRTAASFKEVDR